MSFTVVWLERAEEQLAAAILSARDYHEADRVTRAVERLEARLRNGPGDLGESRAGRSRVAVALPVTIQFELSDDASVVIVTGIRYTASCR